LECARKVQQLTARHEVFAQRFNAGPFISNPISRLLR
jgi:hypothetical protein